MRAEFNQVSSVVTMVDDTQVKATIDAISGAAYTGKPGDGIIVVTAVEDVVNIATKKQGSGAL